MCKNTHSLVKPLEEAHFMGDSDTHHETLFLVFLHSKMPTTKTRPKKKSPEDKRKLLEKMKFLFMKIISFSKCLQPNPRHTSTQVETQPQLHQSHFTALLLSDLPMTPC